MSNMGSSGWTYFLDVVDAGLSIIIKVLVVLLYCCVALVS